MRAAQVQQAGGPFVVVDMPVPEPGPGQVRVKVHACGICGGDAIPRNALFGTKLPRVPGHEIAGVVDAVGAGVEVWQAGQRVGVGWGGGVDFTCEYCRRGDFTNCLSRTIVGMSYDGGYAEYMVAPQDGGGADSRGADLRGGGAVDVCRGHRVQRAAARACRTG